MKILFSLFCAFLLLAGRPVFAQEETPPRPFALEALYLSLGIGGTFIPNGGSPVFTRLTGFLANGWGLSIGIRGGNMATQNAPSFPHHAVVKGFAIFGIKDGFSIVDLCIVRKSWLRGAGQQFRLGLEAGPAIVNTQIHTYSLLTYYNDPVPTYLAELVSKKTTGLQVAVNAAYVPTRAFGVELCLWGNLNAVQPLVGLEGSILLGRLRSKRKDLR